MWFIFDNASHDKLASSIHSTYRNNAANPISESDIYAVSIGNDFDVSLGEMCIRDSSRCHVSISRLLFKIKIRS